MAITVDPVCGMEFPEEDAEEMGAFRVVRDGRVVWLDSSTCKAEYERGR